MGAKVRSGIAVAASIIFLTSILSGGQGSDAGESPGQGAVSLHSEPLLDFHASSLSDDVMITYHNHENRSVAARILLEDLDFVNAFGMYEIFHLDATGEMLKQELGGSPMMGQMLRIHENNGSVEYGPLWRDVYYDVIGFNRYNLSAPLQLPPGGGFIVIGLHNTLADMHVFLEQDASVRVEELTYDPDYVRWGSTWDRGDWDSLIGVGSWAASVHKAQVAIDVRHERHTVAVWAQTWPYASEVSLTTPDGRTCSSTWKAVLVSDNIPPGKFELNALAAGDGDRPIIYTVRDFPAPVWWPESPYRTECMPWNTQS